MSFIGYVLMGCAILAFWPAFIYAGKDISCLCAILSVSFFLTGVGQTEIMPMEYSQVEIWIKNDKVMSFYEKYMADKIIVRKEYDYLRGIYYSSLVRDVKSSTE